VLFHWLDEELRAGRSVVGEANFTPQAARAFEALPPHRTLQLLCTAPRAVVIERYAKRRRHRGHLDDVVLGELRAGLHEEQWEPLPLAGELIRIDDPQGRRDELVGCVRTLLRGTTTADSSLQVRDGRH
jgi:hypothetical protein